MYAPLCWNSCSMIIEQEFQDSGAYIYNVYGGALGRQPLFSEYSADRQMVIGGAALETEKQAFAADFVAKYRANPTAESFVAALLVNAQTAGVDLSSQRADLISAYYSGGDQT